MVYVATGYYNQGGRRLGRGEEVIGFIDFSPYIKKGHLLRGTVTDVSPDKAKEMLAELEEKKKGSALAAAKVSKDSAQAKFDRLSAEAVTADDVGSAAAKELDGAEKELRSAEKVFRAAEGGSGEPVAVATKKTTKKTKKKKKKAAGARGQS